MPRRRPCSVRGSGEPRWIRVRENNNDGGPARSLGLSCAGDLDDDSRRSWGSVQRTNSVVTACGSTTFCAARQPGAVRAVWGHSAVSDWAVPREHLARGFPPRPHARAPDRGDLWSRQRGCDPRSGVERPREAPRRRRDRGIATRTCRPPPRPAHAPRHDRPVRRPAHQHGAQRRGEEAIRTSRQGA